MFRSLFPTLLLEEKLQGLVADNVQAEIDQIVDRLQFSINQEDDTGGLAISDEGIVSTNNLIERYNLIKLKTEVMRVVNQYLEETNTTPKVNVEIHLSNMTLLDVGLESTKHMHSADSLVVVYYYKVPLDSGSLRIYNPNPYLEFQKETAIELTPTVGTLLVFPGWLYHEVLKNNSNSIRQSIAITLQVYKERLE